MEEYDFFKELCHVALATDKHVRFAGVMENSGKLLVGEYRKDIKSPLVNSSSEPEPSSNLFYASYISVTVTGPLRQIWASSATRCQNMKT